MQCTTSSLVQTRYHFLDNTNQYQIAF